MPTVMRIFRAVTLGNEICFVKFFINMKMYVILDNLNTRAKINKFFKYFQNPASVPLQAA